MTTRELSPDEIRGLTLYGWEYKMVTENTPMWVKFDPRGRFIAQYNDPIWDADLANVRRPLSN